MKLQDEHGPLDVDMKMFVAMLRETYLMALAWGIQWSIERDPRYGLLDESALNSLIVRFTNNADKKTWQNAAWLKNYLDKLYDLARKTEEEHT